MEKFLNADPKPDAKRAELLLRNNRARLLASLDELVDACEDIVDPYFYRFVKRRLSGLALGADLNPMLFRLSATLLQAVEAKNTSIANERRQTLATICAEESVSGVMRYLVADREYAPGKVVDLLNDIGDDVFSFKPMPIGKKRIYEGIVTVEKCLDTLRHCAPELHKEILALTQRICFYQIKPLPNGSTMHSGSRLDYLGCVFLNADMEERSWYFWADKIVHEAAHQLLFSIMLEEEVVLNADHERYKSPLREEGRTVTGIYHAAFVIYRIIYFFDALLKKQKLTDKESVGIRASLLDYIQKFHDAHRVIETYGKLTSYGETLMTACESAVCGFERTYDQASV